MSPYLWDFARTNGGSGSPIIFRGRIEACFGWYRICAKTGSAGRSPPIEPVYCRKTHEGTLLFRRHFHADQAHGHRRDRRQKQRHQELGEGLCAVVTDTRGKFSCLVDFPARIQRRFFDVCRMVSVFMIRQKPINVTPRPRRPCCGLFGKGSAQNPKFCSISNI